MQESLYEVFLWIDRINSSYIFVMISTGAKPVFPKTAHATIYPVSSECLSASVDQSLHANCL